jgi:uncharacterized protein (DUF1778 family)
VPKRPEPKRLRPETIHVMATTGEKDELQKAANLTGLALSAFMRAAALKEARRLINKQG